MKIEIVIKASPKEIDDCINTQRQKESPTLNFMNFTVLSLIARNSVFQSPYFIGQVSQNIQNIRIFKFPFSYQYFYGQSEMFQQ
jgi:hypothetical protein